MNKLYNTQEEIASEISEFLKKTIPNIRLTQLNIIPYIILGMTLSESCVSSDIAKVLKNRFSEVQFNSVIKRINRFYSNKLFDPYSFYSAIIKHVIENFSLKHEDKNVYITFDHMFSKHNYSVLMFTMRVGTFGIPVWFKCFEKISNNDAFKLETMKEGIIAISNLFKDTDFNLIFLADRWFGSPKILEIIDNLNHTYCVRIKGNIDVYQNGLKVKSKRLKHRKYHSVTHKDVLITKERFKTTLVYSSTQNTKDPWIIATNGEAKNAIKHYGYRFGSIECMFKAQKSNGFYLEKVSNANLKSFETMYTMVCTCILLLTIIGADYSKNTKCYKSTKIETHKQYIVDDKIFKRRIMSLFNTGLALFKRAFNSHIYIRIPLSFKLYDI